MLSFHTQPLVVPPFTTSSVFEPRNKHITVSLISVERFQQELLLQGRAILVTPPFAFADIAAFDRLHVGVYEPYKLHNLALCSLWINVSLPTFMAGCMAGFAIQ